MDRRKIGKVLATLSVAGLLAGVTLTAAGCAGTGKGSCSSCGAQTEKGSCSQGSCTGAKPAPGGTSGGMGSSE